VIPDQFFDRTRARAHESTFFGEGIVGHITFAHPVCHDLGNVLEESCRATAAVINSCRPSFRSAPTSTR
ncbi:MAG TPA: hypothetical protein VK422_11140, partial [Pyrinomonadaceae bacterium]|nr:hypothetical protein [Pyrinomonadaceae bacterium]